ncbi:uncharacterized protein M6B38_370960 [Iris pallida]|uniref:Uncharacterized protein n=1 Tax=Iris pallida TaxID=29817 RepID=A0AAX6GED0_IRIPA|nr:uncharacterized protein M6B38_152765 [Iris pallida]KAJ6827070.1 uncharacterized protein M6B38_370960 [Iris pallida]
MHPPTEQREEEEEEEERLPLSIHHHHHSSSSSDDDDEGFEFAFVSDPNADAAISAADDIFADGKILPIYPSPFFSSNLNNKVSSKQLRNLLLEEVEEKRNDPSKSEELEGIPEGTYCVWTPNSSSALKKSGSTGTSSSSLRVKIRDLVIGRSRSDGKEKLLYFPAATGRSAGSYKKAGGSGGGGRKTFLPYRQDILGLFGSGKATGRAHTHRRL